MPGATWTALRTCSDSVEAGFFQSILEQHGIPVEVRGGITNALSPALPPHARRPVIFVVSTRLDEARRLITETSGTPEEDVRVTCPSCRVDSPGTFGQCWSCGAALGPQAEARPSNLPPSTSAFPSAGVNHRFASPGAWALMATQMAVIAALALSMVRGQARPVEAPRRCGGVTTSSALSHGHGILVAVDAHAAIRARARP